jgi:hypothetical protein
MHINPLWRNETRPHVSETKDDLTRDRNTDPTLVDGLGATLDQGHVERRR